MSKKEKKGFFAEFKKFIARGNVMDMAVGVVVGSAFTKIVNSLVNDIIMPFIGMIIGGVDFSDLKIIIAEATEETAEAAIRYGSFIQAIVDFLLIALTVFVVIRTINRLQDIRKKKEEEEAAAAAAAAPAEPPAPPADIALLTEIRDLLKK